MARRNLLGLTKVEKQISRQRGEWNKNKLETDRIMLRELEREVKSILIEAKRRQVLDKIEDANLKTGNCWNFLRELGKGGKTPDAPLRDGNRQIFGEKDKAEFTIGGCSKRQRPIG